MGENAKDDQGDEIMNIVREYIESLIGDRAGSFDLWAFGDKYKDYYTRDYPEAWNKLHGDDFKIDGRGDVKQDLKKMIDLFDKNNPSNIS